MWTGLLTSLIISGLVFLLPIKKKYGPISMSKSTFKRYYAIIYPAMLVFVGCMIYGLFEGLLWLDGSPSDPYLYELNSKEDQRLLVAIFCGGSIGIILTFTLVRVWLKEQEMDFWQRYDEMYAFSAKTVLVILTYACAIIGCGIQIIGSLSQLKISEDEVAVTSLFEGHFETYPLDEINGITQHGHAINGKRNSSHIPYYVISFTDGYLWRSNGQGRTPQPLDIEAINVLSSLASIEVEYKD